MTTTIEPAAAATSTVGPLPDDPELRERVLLPYRENCRYLLSAQTYAVGDTVTATCDFRLEESCYIDSTGHFNAVEFNICFNQVVYFLIAKSVKEGLLPALAGWTLDDYWDRQLGNVLIVDYHSRFRRPMSSGDFFGEVTFATVRLRPAREGKAPLVLIESTCRFWDDTGGNCDGEVLLAITDPPTR